MASDLDGTLLNEDSEISVETVKAIEMAQKSGLRFIAATGRAWGTAYPFFKKAGINVDYVLLNGAEFRTSSGTVIYQEMIPEHVAKKIVNYLSETDIDFEINTDKGDFSTDTEMCQSASEFPELEEFWKQNLKILKIFVFSDETVAIKKVKRYLRNCKAISVTSSDIWNIEITAENAKKSNMLKKAVEFYQTAAEDVVVFGDGENDKTMFQEFCHSRAVVNAVPAIRNLAEKVIESNQNNGVAKEIYQIVGGL